jgi:hypothetical protein
MEKKEIFKKVGMIMAELNEQYEYLSDKPENLNDLELELFLANSNFLTDHIEILKKLNGYLAPSKDPVIENHPIHNTQPTNSNDDIQSNVEETEPEELISAAKDQEITSVSEAPAEVPETKEEAAPEVTEDKSVAENISPEETHPETEQSTEAEDSDASTEIIKEVVIPEKTISVEAPVTTEEPPLTPTINDIISAQMNPSTVASRFTSTPVADLKTIINLNDKLLFIKDLFNGYSLAYSEAIELLNRFDNFEAADNFLKVNYAAKNNWSEKQQTVDKLYEILKRRFAK